jgi:glycosyltransferase involved in cell wall biosynthesis
MKILFNASNLKKGGGVQVALSLIEEFYFYDNFQFHLVVSDSVYNQLNLSNFNSNFLVSRHNFKPNVFKVIFGHDFFLSKVENEFSPDWVFTVFGPSYWIPKSRHLIGFAIPHYLYYDSPFFRIISFKEKISIFILKILCFWNLSKKKNFFWVETNDVKKRLSKFLFIDSVRIKVVSNTCHSVFYRTNNNLYSRYEVFFNFPGKKAITISANYIHKNLVIIKKVVPILIKKKIELKFFLTLNHNEFNSFNFNTDYVINLGPVNITDCPFLYSKVDFLFLPTLLECFSASYVEAMKMNVPILTSDLAFARGVCGDAAEYFDPLDEEDIVKKIIFLISNQSRVQEMIFKGQEKLKEFPTSKERASSILNIFFNLDC